MFTLSYIKRAIEIGELCVNYDSVESFSQIILLYCLNELGRCIIHPTFPTNYSNLNDYNKLFLILFDKSDDYFYSIDDDSFDKIDKLLRKYRIYNSTDGFRCYNQLVPQKNITNWAKVASIVDKKLM